jgi:hypothetical protein
MLSFGVPAVTFISALAIIVGFLVSHAVAMKRGGAATSTTDSKLEKKLFNALNKERDARIREAKEDRDVVNKERDARIRGTSITEMR